MMDEGRTKQKLCVGQTWTPAKRGSPRTVVAIYGTCLEWLTLPSKVKRVGQSADFRTWIERTGATVREGK